ncbi:universal stress protein [Oleiagrimonas soli]|uniref:Nucleotide-binding universal stress UspA family protein n=1 Tax=Oleiagrimonas soli TaxID=1543381 RepID=A0A099CT93_9GAMM|nr:universal stress protein [Oleiagrimonas soli]KGI76979.1 universal stress protein UspA [Oleiagrimonas soli]MBB6185187.1 nucleotide-binding universal stress UspA family protein [Oleiagrimonas soli]
MSKHYLVGYDGSVSADRAFDFVAEQARHDGGRIRVVAALQMTDGGSDTCAMMMTDQGARKAHELLDALKSRAADLGGRIDTEVVYGSPGDVLLAQVAAHGIDHIIVGHTGRGVLARWLIGSVSDDILARARVPVTVVR